MASIRHGFYDELIAAPGFLLNVPGGAAAVVGDDEQHEFPPPGVEPPVFYLEVLDATPAASGDPNYLDGGFRLWGYDWLHAGYRRVRRALLAAGAAITEADPTTGDDLSDRYVDDETGEVVFHVRPRGLGPETQGQPGGIMMRAQYYTWQTRQTMRGEWP